MSEEEKKSVEYCKNKIDYANMMKEVFLNVRKRSLQELLNLIQKQDKIIDKMAEYFEGYEMNDVITFENKEQVKEYFEEEVEK